jgi:hypothetical protein
MYAANLSCQPADQTLLLLLQDRLRSTLPLLSINTQAHSQGSSTLYHPLCSLASCNTAVASNHADQLALSVYAHKLSHVYNTSPTRQQHWQHL